MDADARRALIEESAKKSGLIWVRRAEPDARPQGVWHVWHDGAAYVLAGGLEQALPQLGDRAEVTVRSKDKGSRLVTWPAEVTVVAPDSEEWSAVVPALLGKRLNLPDGEQAPRRWARESVLYRLTPAGDLIESPDDRPTQSHAAPPPRSPATTHVPRPLHVFGRPKLRRELRKRGR